jgi:molybdopterin converting factor small subunit
MPVKLKIPDYLRNKTDGEVIAEVEGRTVHECIEALIHRYPGLAGEILDDQGMILLKWMISINDRMALSDELSHPVREGDMIALLPVVDGG